VTTNRGLLTKRERQILALLALGLSKKQIARSLGVSMATCKTHVENVFRKFNVHNRIQALRAAREANYQEVM